MGERREEREGTEGFCEESAILLAVSITEMLLILPFFVKQNTNGRITYIFGDIAQTLISQGFI